MNKWLMKCPEYLRDKRLLLLLLALACLLLWPGPQESGMTQEERRVAHTLSQVRGAGCVQVSIYYTQTASAFGGESMPVGAVVVSEGAGDITVRMRLTEALKTLLGLHAEQVIVLEMEADDR